MHMSVFTWRSEALDGTRVTHSYELPDVGAETKLRSSGRAVQALSSLLTSPASRTEFEGIFIGVVLKNNDSE